MTPDIRDQLAARRRELRYSQAAVAERAGVSRNYVSLVERGEVNPTLDGLSRLARALGCGVEVRLVRASEEGAG